VRDLAYAPIDVVNYRDDIVDEFGHRSRLEVARHATWGSVQQQSTGTEQLGAAATVTTYAVFLPATETVNAGDEVEVDGHRYRIDGAPVFPRTMRGVHHIELTCRYVGAVDPTPAGA
jgi:hypothetical protein